MHYNYRHAWKRIGGCVVVVIAVWIVQTILVQPSSWRSKGDGPSLKIAKTNLDLGSLSQSSLHKATFLIENRGTRRLVLNELGCGCGETVRDAILIPPRQSEEVTIGLDTQFAWGEIEKKVQFSTNDVAQPQIELTVRAQVVVN
jgi:hypothetical protein